MILIRFYCLGEGGINICYLVMGSLKLFEKFGGGGKVDRRPLV